MNKRHSFTAFFLEALLLIGIFLFVILILARTFAGAHRQSTQAYLLTNAVCLASDAAEQTSSAESLDLLSEQMNTADNAVLDGDTLTVRYAPDMTPQADGSLSVRIHAQPEQTTTGTLTRYTISVVLTPDDSELYTLETAVYGKDGDSA